ncbi:MAG TPA: glycosyl hydrolase, partial [Thermoanaerobaculia bacterium]|nr:glycosyl hydrolase [Thermoanaerobaculia bacterium]
MKLVMRLALSLAFLVCPVLGAAEKAAEPTGSPAAPSGPFGALKFRYIGPEGNRVSAVAGVPGDPNVYYAGAASGGIWKTTDAGVHWRPIFDDQPVSSIGALAVAPSDPNVVWAGTG